MANEQYPSLELPKPVVGGSEQQSSEAKEKTSQTAEKGSNQPSTEPTAPAVTSVIVPDVPAVSMPTDDAVQSAVPTTSAAAGDSDLIEKIWVDKAKNIVLKTQSDPHVQKQEISKLSATYLKQHFNKDIKVDDAVAK